MKASSKIGGLVGLAAGLAIGYKMSQDKGEKFGIKDALVWGGGGLVGGGLLGIRNLAKFGLMFGGSRLTEGLSSKLSGAVTGAEDSEKATSKASNYEPK